MAPTASLAWVWRFDLPGIRVLTRFVQKYTLSVAHLERGGINLDFAVEDDVLPSAEHTHEGDRVRRNPIDCGGPATGRSRVGRLRESGHRESDGGERRRDRRPAGLCQEQTSVLFYVIRPCNGLDTIVSNGRKKTMFCLLLDTAVKTVAYRWQVIQIVETLVHSPDPLHPHQRGHRVRRLAGPADQGDDRRRLLCCISTPIWSLPCYRRTHACFAVLVFVHQLDMSVEEPPHLVTEAGLNAAASAAAVVDPQLPHEAGERVP